MSSNHQEEETNIDLVFNNRNRLIVNDYSTQSNFYVEQKFDDDQIYNDVSEVFTDLQSCSIPADTDSQSSEYNSSDLDDDDDDKQSVNVYFSPLTTENTNKSNEDFTLSKNKNQVNDKTDEKTITNSRLNELDLSESSNDIINLINKDLSRFVFISVSKHISNYIQCRLIRNKSILSQTFYLEVEYSDNGESICLLMAEKQFKISGQSHYIISVISKYPDNFNSAELISDDLTGTRYVLNLLNEDKRQQLAVILYETNFLGTKGPRKIEVLLPKFNDQMQDFIEASDFDEYDSKEQSNCFIHLHNKPPNWDSYKSCYTLNFSGKDRAVIPSIKNFQMILKNEENVEQIVMEFGRMLDNEFSCDFRYPLSLIQAFAIALSALESRWFRE
ncbi:unnamed protein product [Rotaria sp. Silwood1]|nr:unnamed protein product [Rotaria sp. Silwood1]